MVCTFMRLSNMKSTGRGCIHAPLFINRFGGGIEITPPPLNLVCTAKGATYRKFNAKRGQQKKRHSSLLVQDYSWPLGV